MHKKWPYTDIELICASICELNAVVEKETTNYFLAEVSNNSMNDSQYTKMAEVLFDKIEEVLDRMIEEEVLLDYENINNVITIDCLETETKIIISRQQASRQIWIAAKSDGFHLTYDDQLWYCNKTDESLQSLLSRLCTQQSKSEIVFKGID